MLKHGLLAIVFFSTSFTYQASATILRLRGAHVVTNCSAYSGDGGCANRNQYVLDANGVQQQASYKYSTNPCAWAYHTAQSGQLPSSADPLCASTSDPTYKRNARMHYYNINLPYVDYPIGAANPSTQISMSQYTDPTGQCHYTSVSNGMPYPLGQLGQSVIYCKPVASGTSRVDTYVQGVDFSRDLPTDVTGTRSGQLIIAQNYGGLNTSQYLHIWNNKFGNYAPNGQTTTSEIDLVLFGSSTGTPFFSADIYNNFFDGNFRGASNPNLNGVVKGIVDSRAGPAVGGNNPQVATLTPLTTGYNVFYDLGHDAIYSDGAMGAFSVTNTAIDGICESPNCHQELAEVNTNLGRDGFGPSVTYDNIVYNSPATVLNITNTAPIYGTGSTNGWSYPSHQITHVIAVMNLKNCTNSAGSGFGPTNPCLGTAGGGTGVSAGGAALFYSGDAETSTETIKYNVVDNTGADSCTVTDNGLIGGSTSGALYTNPYGQAALGGHYGIWPGMSIYDAGPSQSMPVAPIAGFVNAKINSYNTAANFPMFQGRVDNGTPGVAGNVLTLDAGPASLLTGQPLVDVNGHPFALISGAGPGVTGKSYSLTDVSGGTLNTVIADGTYMQSPNPSSCTPGYSPQCGTYNLSSSEPAASSAYIAYYATFDNIYHQDGGVEQNIFIGGFWGSSDPGAHHWDVSVLYNPGKHPCVALDTFY